VAQRAGAQVVPLNRIPPHNLDAEQSVLGAMLESKEAIANVVEVVHSEDFYKPAHVEIYEAILALYGRGEQPDAITCAEELSRRGSLDRIGGKPYIYGLLEAYPTASSAGHYARIVEERALLRRLIDAGNKVQEIGFSIPENVAEGIDQAEELVYEVGNRRLRDAIQPIRKLLTENMEAIETLYERGENVTGLASGFPDLDEMTAGFQPSNLVIIAARPSMGKSSLIGDVALHAALHHREPVVIFSLEMSRHELVQRFLSSEARVDSQRIRRGSLQEQDWTRLSSALGRLAEAPIFIDDSANITLMEIRAKCRRLKAKFGLGLIIVDYLQLMQSPRKSENRQQEVSEISRALKILARELEVPVICASQLNRGVEYRSDKRPLLGDLRESGCLTGDALVTLGSGAQAPIAQLVGHQPQVMSLSPNWRIGIQQASKVWYTGHKPVFKLSTASGRTVRATGNHPFRMLEGWRALGDLGIGDRIAIPRTYPDASATSSACPHRIVLLAHLIGDGCYAPRQPLHYTSASDENISMVQQAAFAAFAVRGRRVRQGNWQHLYLSAGANKWHPNPIRTWLRQLGIDGQRSANKIIPEFVFGLPKAELALFLRHLWATDGCIWMRKNGRGPLGRIYYASTSETLARQVQHLLDRLGVGSRLRRSEKEGYRPCFHVHVVGALEQLRFAEVIGGVGRKDEQIRVLATALASVRPNTNADTLPSEVWELVRSKMIASEVSQRRMAQLRGTAYGGTSHFSFSPSRAVLGSYATALADQDLQQLADSDLFWDVVTAIEADGTADVYDMSVPGTNNFIANGIVCHNSIEQDSDLVMFIYRDEVYNPETENRGEAELILAKHRNGPTGVVRLAFMNQYTKFASIAKGPSF
jgi:replicative DNA helicase